MTGLIQKISKLLDAYCEKQNDFSPEYLAEKFWQNFSSDQSYFFNHLAILSKNHKWGYLHKNLTEEGKKLIDDLKLHTDNED
jgi:hypothetical protein